MIIGYQTPLVELLEADEISAKTYNVLHAQGMNTLGDVDKKFADRSKLKRLQHLGRNSFREIITCLKAMDVTDSKNINMDSTCFFQQIPLEGQKAFEEAFEQMLAIADPVSEELKARFPTVADLHFAILQDTEKVYALNLTLSKKENIDLRKRLLRFVATACAPELQAELDERAYMGYSGCKRILESFPLGISYQEINTYFLTPLQISLCEQAYKRFLDCEVSERLRIFIHLQKKDYSLLVELFDKSMEELSYTMDFGGKKLLHKELFEKLPLFKQEWLRISNLDGQQAELEDIGMSYPWLDEQERVFVYAFHKNQGHYPMFYLLLKQLQHSSARNDQLFVLRYGLNGSAPWDIDRLAEYFQLSTDMVKSIVLRVSAIKRMEIATEQNREAYKWLFDRPFLAENVPEVKKVINSEQLGLDFFGFVALAKLISSFRPYTVNKTLLLLNDTQLPSLNLRSCFDALYREGRTLRSKNALIPLDLFLDRVGPEKRDAAVAMLAYVATRVFHFTINENQQLVCLANMVDVRKVLKAILRQEGKPLPLEEIHSRFMNLYPDIPMTKDSIKEYLSTCPGIKAQGLINLYEWVSCNHVYNGTIRDLVESLLKKADRPLHVDELLVDVILHFPRTNKYSIRSNIRLDTQGRFVSFGQGLYGIAGRVYPGYSEQHG